jgi:SAM-dependent methyltransferase
VIYLFLGVAVVPISLWKASQKAEGDLWKNVGMWSRSSDANDRAIEHWKAFDGFKCLEPNLKIGNVIEVGAGPWTQFKGIMHCRQDLAVSSFTVWEPSADRYIQEVSSCSYKSKTSLTRWDGSGSHPFDVKVISQGGEHLLTDDYKASYDTLVSINVIEHVQDVFKYLTGLYTVLKPGGLLIFHDRYYRSANIVDGDVMHPIRIRRGVLDHFLSGFDIIFNNCTASYEGEIIINNNSEQSLAHNLSIYLHE